MSTVDAAELHQRLLEQVAGLRDSEAWIAAMAAAARLHDYSLGNWLLLWSQAKERGTSVTRPAGYRTWQRLGRQVRRGERGYRILAPVTRRVGGDDEDQDESARIVTGFRVVSVFDVSQTDGDPLPEVAPRRLHGDDGAGLLEGVVRLIEAEEYRVSFASLRGPNGTTRPASRDVIVEEELEGTQRTKTTIHELAHVLMHVDGEAVDCRGVIEVEAEAVSHVVCAASGLDTSAYSVAYVAHWAETTADPDRTLLATSERVVSVARRILAALRHSESSTIRSHQTESLPLVASDSNDMMEMSDMTPAEATRKDWV